MARSPEENHGLPSLRAEVETWFSQALGRAPAGGLRRGLWLPSLDVIEEPGGYVVELDMPGVRLQNLKIAVAGRRLSVSGRREFVRDVSGAQFRVRERWSGEFARSIELPGPVDAQRLTATMEEGILRIMLPRRGSPP